MNIIILLIYYVVILLKIIITTYPYFLVVKIRSIEHTFHKTLYINNGKKNN